MERRPRSFNRIDPKRLATAGGLIGAVALPAAAQALSIEAPAGDLQPRVARPHQLKQSHQHASSAEGSAAPVAAMEPVVLPGVALALKSLHTGLKANVTYYAPPHKPESAFKQELASENVHLHIMPGNNSTDAFTPDWWRCVIRPESSGRAHITAGLYGILTSAWHAYGMPGVPGDYPPVVQEHEALKIYHDNGGFGPGAWNNTAQCGKAG